MKPNKAVQHLQSVVDTQRSVTTNKIKDMVDIIVSHNKMLQKDNGRLRKKIRKLKEENL